MSTEGLATIKILLSMDNLSFLVYITKKMPEFKHSYNLGEDSALARSKNKYVALSHMATQGDISRSQDPLLITLREVLQSKHFELIVKSSDFSVAEAAAKYNFPTREIPLLAIQVAIAIYNFNGDIRPDQVELVRAMDARLGNVLASVI